MAFFAAFVHFDERETTEKKESKRKEGMNEKRKGKNEKRTKEAIELKNENSPCCKWCDH